MNDLVETFYLDGYENIPENKPRAIELFQRAADMGHDEAQGNLGVCYMTGNGVLQNAQQAVSWFEKAATQGHANSQKNLGMCYRDGDGVPADVSKAIV